MPYNDAILNEADRQKVAALGEQWKQYSAAGNAAAADSAHAQAEAIRGKYGYSGGASGSEYVPTGTNTMLREAQDQSGAINNLYDKNYTARTAALESAWNQKQMDYDRAEQKITPTYDAQRNDLETQFQIARHNMGERALANGLGSGTGTQVALSQQNEYLRDHGEINKAEATARSDLAFERAKASAAYRDAVAQALADNDVERAKALYEEAVRVDNSIVSTSQAQMSMDLQREATEWSRQKEQADTLAKFGDFSGYAALGYTAEQIAQMRAVWAAENPLLAAAIGMGGYGYGYSGGYSGRSGSGAGKSAETNGDGIVPGPGNSSTSGIGTLMADVGKGVGSLLTGRTGGLLFGSNSGGGGSWTTVQGAGRMSWQEVSNGLKNGTIQATSTGGYKYVGKK